MNLRLLLTFISGILLVLSSCGDSQHGLNEDAEIKMQVQRFDQELFKLSTDTLPEAISYLYKEYDDFLDVFSFHIIGIGSPSGRDYQAYLSMFLNDRLNREVFTETQKVFPGLGSLEKELSRAFSRYKSAFPDAEIPKVVSYVSRFNNPFFTVSDYIGIGLDRYLGTSSPYYKKLELPQYQKQNMFPEKMPSDIMSAWGSAIFAYNDSVDNVLSRIIHEGKILYFTSAMLPGEPDSLVIGYTKSQMKWVKENEEQMWTSMVEKKILFSRDAMDIRKLTGPAPFTYFFSNESPGRAGSWIGWRIFSEYAKRNPGLSFAALMNETDYEKILRFSKYNP